MFEKSVVVRFSECDGLGHVNNGTYFTYFEEARMDVFRLFNPELTLDTWNLIVVSTRCDFLQQATYAETLRILTWIGRLGNSSFVTDHVILNEAGEYLTRAQATLIAYNYPEKKSIPLWSEVRTSLSLHLQAPENVPALRA